jgi:hypothetical protein
VFGLSLIVEKGQSQEKSSSKDDLPNLVFFYSFIAAHSDFSPEQPKMKKML